MTMWNNFLWKSVSLWSLKVIGWNLASFNMYTSAFGTAHYYEKEIWPNILVFFRASMLSLLHLQLFMTHVQHCIVINWYWWGNCLLTAPTLILRVTIIPLNFSSNHYKIIFNFDYNFFFSVPEVTGRQLWGIHSCGAQNKQWQVFHRGNGNGETIFRREGFPFEQVHFVLL